MSSRGMEGEKGLFGVYQKWKFLPGEKKTCWEKNQEK